MSNITIMFMKKYNLGIDDIRKCKNLSVTQKHILIKRFANLSYEDILEESKYLDSVDKIKVKEFIGLKVLIVIKKINNEDK